MNVSEMVFNNMVLTIVTGRDKVPESIVNDSSGIRYRDNKPVNKKKVVEKQQDDYDDIL